MQEWQTKANWMPIFFAVWYPILTIKISNESSERHIFRDLWIIINLIISTHKSSLPLATLTCLYTVSTNTSGHRKFPRVTDMLWVTHFVRAKSWGRVSRLLAFALPFEVWPEAIDIKVASNTRVSSQLEHFLTMQCSDKSLWLRPHWASNYAVNLDL